MRYIAGFYHPCVIRKTIKFSRILSTRLVHFSLLYPGKGKGNQSYKERFPVTVIVPSWPGYFDFSFQKEKTSLKKVHPNSLLLFLTTTEKAQVKVWTQVRLLFHVPFSEHQLSFMGSNSQFGVYCYWALRSRTNQPKRINWEMSLIEGYKAKACPNVSLCITSLGRNRNMCFFRCNILIGLPDGRLNKMYHKPHYYSIVKYPA